MIMVMKVLGVLLCVCVVVSTQDHVEDFADYLLEKSRSGNGDCWKQLKDFGEALKKNEAWALRSMYMGKRWRARERV